MLRKKRLRMNNRVSSSVEYHWATAHVRNRIRPHYLDFGHYPKPFKTYGALKRIPLIKGEISPGRDLMGLFRGEKPTESDQRLGFPALSRALYKSYGVTREEKARGIRFFSRTVPSAGGLYPCHIYLMVRYMEALETGVYYCHMIQESLDLIHRDGFSLGRDFDLSFVVTGIFFNSAWKYRERAFRYMLLDSGHLVENLNLALRAEGLSPQIDYDFEDDRISDILALDKDKEVPLVCVHVNGKASGPEERIRPAPDSSGPCLKAIEDESVAVSYPLLRQIHELGKARIETRPYGAEAANVLAFEPSEPLDRRVLLDTEAPNPPLDYERAVLSRRSKRNFFPVRLDRKNMDLLLESASSLYKGQPEDSARALPFLSLGVLFQNVEGFDDGFYLFSGEGGSLRFIREGQFCEPLSRVCLDQQWISRAAVNFLFMANLTELEKALGPRGYRLLLMDAGRMAQRVYLAAAGLSIGCCGVGALYDEEARTLLDLNPDSALFYAVSAGPVKGSGF
jgi:SagB-type dehydrogenase family enzyme